MSKPFLILQIRPEDTASDDEYQAFLRAGDISPDDTARIRLDRQELSADLDLRQFSGVIIGGGPACISDDPANKPSYQLRFERELHQLLEKVIERDMPYFGSCYGIGLLADHLEASVGKSAYSEPVGATQLLLTEEGTKDPLLKNVSPSLQAFAGHKESVLELPKGAIHLIKSKTCPNQMIRYKQNIYGLQFHAELDAAGLELRIRTYRDLGYFKPEEADDLIAQGYSATVTEPQKIFKNFIDRYKSLQ